MERVQCLGFRVLVKFWVWGIGFRVWGLRVQSLGFSFSGFGFRDSFHKLAVPNVDTQNLLPLL